MEEIEEKYICPNCDAKNDSTAKYCNQCKQKVGPLKVRIGEFISQFFDAVFNIDNKFFKSIFHAFLPAKLKLEFFKGRKASFYHPLRFYFVCVLLFFFVLSFLNISDFINLGNENLSKKYENSKLVRDQRAYLKGSIDSFKLETSTEMDTSLLDTLYERLFFVIDEDSISIVEKVTNDTSDFDLLFKEIQLSSEEMFLDDLDSVVESKNLEHWIDRFVLKQILKGIRDLKSLNNFIVANLTWLFIAVIPFFALILKLFYIRRKRYFLEHYVFLLHLFSGLLLFSILALLLYRIEALSIPSAILISIVYLIFPFVAIKRYYKQGFIKTLIKYFGIGFFFTIALVLCFAIFFIVTAAFF